MKIIVLANGDFAAPSFERLAESDSVVALITMPSHGRQTADIPVSPVRRVAERAGLPIFQPENVNAPEGIELLRRFEPDLIFVCDYGKILSPETIRTARLGGVNLHGSLLPKYRGAAPINRAIYDGETTLGVSVIHITPEVDAGPVIAAASLETSLSETSVEIEARLAQLGAGLISDAVARIADGTAEPLPQNHAEATGAPKLKKAEGKIDWSRGAAEIVNHYRAFQPWPKTFTDWPRTPEKPPLRLILGPVTVCTDNAPNAESRSCGEIVEADGDRLVIRCGDGAIRVERVQPAGKRAMSAEEFLRGYRMKPGDRLV